MMSRAYDLASIKTVAEFARWSEGQPQKYEFIDGRIVLQAGTSSAHSIVQVNIITAFRVRLRGGPCRVHGSDMLVNTKSNRKTGRYPDVTVRCNPVPPEDEYVIEDPTILVEILSPSTERIDRGEKLDEYRAMRSVEHVLIVDPGKVWVEHHYRTTGGWDSDTHTNEAVSLSLDPPGIAVSLAEIYEDVPIGR